MPSSHSITPAQRLDSFHFIDRVVSAFTPSQSWTTAALLCTALLLSQSTPALATASSKRGLIDITTRKFHPPILPFDILTNTSLFISL